MDAFLVALVIVVILAAVGLGIGRLIFGPMPHEAFCVCERCQEHDAEIDARYREWRRIRRERAEAVCHDRHQAAEARTAGEEGES